MNLIFHKMTLLGNDFIVIDNVTYNFEINSDIIKLISNRNLGIGCDQVLILRPPSDEQSDFDYLIYNADGSESGQCGNGSLCLSSFIKLNKLSLQNKIKLNTKTTSIEIYNTKSIDNKYTVNLGKYNIEHKDTLNLDNIIYLIYKINVGNPHLIIFLEDNFNIDKNKLINLIDEKLVQNNNISFVSNKNNKINIITYERGVGLTLACGSAASAASIACFDKNNSPSNKFEVCFKHGSVFTEVNSDKQEIFLSGCPDYVFTGEMVF